MILFFPVDLKQSCGKTLESAKQADQVLSRVVPLQSIILVNKDIRVWPMHGEQCTSVLQKHCVKQGPKNIETLKKFYIFLSQIM